MERRKAQEIDRLYVCGDQNCHKQYGSYPALYTHIKLKHKGIQPQGTIKSIQQIKQQIKSREYQKISSSHEEALESELLKLINFYLAKEKINKHNSERKKSRDYLQCSSTNHLINFLDRIACNIKQTLFKELCILANLVNHCIEQRKSIQTIIDAKDDYNEINQYVQDYIEYEKEGKFKLLLSKKFIEQIVWIFINVIFLRN